MALIEAELVVNHQLIVSSTVNGSEAPFSAAPACVVRQTRAAMSTRGPIATSSLT